MQIEHLDKAMEPRLTPEEQAELDIAMAEFEKERMEQEWDSWGTSPHQLASQQRALELLGGSEG